jgi:PAS domain S-box-containing protein
LIDYKQLVEALADALIVADPSGVIRFWNPAAERLFGFAEAKALGSSLDLIVPERFREHHWAGYKKTMATGETRYAHDVLRVPAVHKDGRPLSIAFTVGLLYGPQGDVTGILAVIRDETARFAEDRNLRKRLVELEQKEASTSRRRQPANNHQQSEGSKQMTATSAESATRMAPSREGQSSALTWRVKSMERTTCNGLKHGCNGKAG